MIISSAKIRKTTLLINWSFISAFRETISILHQMNTRFKKKSSIFARPNLNRSKDKPNRKSQAQAKMLKLLSKQWEINSITKVERFRLFTLLLKKEELQLVLLLPTTFEVKLLSGKCGIATLRNLRNKTKMTKRRRSKMRKKREKL